MGREILYRGVCQTQLRGSEFEKTPPSASAAKPGANAAPPPTAPPTVAVDPEPPPPPAVEGYLRLKYGF